MIFAVVWRGGVSCVWVVALDVGGCVTSVHSLLKSKTVSETEQKTHPSTGIAKVSAQLALLTVTHPSIPSQEGKPPRYKPLIVKQKTASKTHLSRGAGSV